MTPVFPEDEVCLERVQSHLATMQQDEIVARLFASLKQGGELALLGGAIREIALGGIPRDYDLVTAVGQDELEESLSWLPIEYNQYGGCKIFIAGHEFDIWPLYNTLAFSLCEEIPSFTNLHKSAFFDLDSPTVCLSALSTELTWCRTALEKKVLGIMPFWQELLDAGSWQPKPDMVLKAAILMDKYGLTPSPYLQDYLAFWLHRKIDHAKILARACRCHYRDNRYDADFLLMQLKAASGQPLSM